MRILASLAALLIASTLLTSCRDLPGEGSADGTVTMAQVVPTLGYVSLDTARAFDTFSAEGLEYKHVQLSGGGDPAALAALESGDADFAAVGAEAPLLGIAEESGEYQIVYALMGQMSLDLTVSDAFLEKAGVSPSDPLKERLAALKGARFGVSALGGAQERASRWIAQHGGLDPDSDIEIVNAGPPSALLAGMDNGRIDAFMLTEPNGTLAEERGLGQVLVRPGTEIQELEDFYHLVLVTRKDVVEQNPELVNKVVRSLNQANDLIVNQPNKVASKLHDFAYEEVSVDVLNPSVKALGSGVEDNGELTAEGLTEISDFMAATGKPVQLDVQAGEDEWWTNKFVASAE